MFFKYSCQKALKKNCGRPVFLEEFQAAINFSKVSLHFNKIPNSLRQVLQIYSQICIVRVPQKKSSRSSQQRLTSKCQGNLVVKLMTMITFLSLLCNLWYRMQFLPSFLNGTNNFLNKIKKVGDWTIVVILGGAWVNGF